MSSGIEAWIEKKINNNETFTTREIREELGVSRQAVNYQLKKFRKRGQIRKVGSTKRARYEPASGTISGETVQRTFQRAGLEEHSVFEELVVDAGLREKLNENSFSIVRYSFTEVLNNAIEHSEASEIQVEFILDAFNVEFRVADDGLGIFNKIQSELDFSGERRAVQELIKGKVTTDPERHSGEGLFFTSRSGDRVSIESSSYRLTFDNKENEVGLSQVSGSGGTAVEFAISRQARRTMREIFDEYSGADFNYEFGKTEVNIELFTEAEKEFVSRSRARRLLHGLDKFEVIELDFSGVKGIGQGFADEVFRVFPSRIESVEMIARNTNEAVRTMIEHVRNEGKTDDL